MVRLSFAGREWDALLPGALFWPDRQALVVADLHLEKASFYAAAGQMLPPYDSLATLSALAELVARTGAREMWCLGDSFHDARGCERLPEDAQALLLSLTATVRWTWVAGNHDAAATRLADHCGGTVLDETVVDGIVLRHEAEPADARPELSGHFHPKLRLSLKGRNVARRCFVASATKIILPAFGALTGGLDAGHPVIASALGRRPAQALVPLADRLLRFPLAA
jgi:DNA ligase-associated metallophosphoesterase